MAMFLIPFLMMPPVAIDSGARDISVPAPCYAQVGGKELLAYIIVIILSRFCLTAGVFLGALLAFLLKWLPERVRDPLCAFLIGTTGPLLAVGLAYGLFYLLMGPGSFGIGPFLAAMIPLSIPIANNLKQAGNLDGSYPDSMAMTRVDREILGTISSMKVMVMGELIGVVLAAVLLLVHYVSQLPTSSTLK